MKLPNVCALRQFKLKYIVFAIKLLLLKARYGSSLTLTSYSLALENDSLLEIEDNAAASFGDRVYIRRNTHLGAYDKACLDIGSRVFINRNCTIVARFGIAIGDDCLIGENVLIYDHDHEFSELGRPIRDQGYRGGRINIGRRVWIASSVFIGKGVTIGDDAVIGAHSVITKDVPSNSVVVPEVNLKVRRR